MTDEELAMQFLAGWLERTSRGRLRSGYYKANSEEESRAKAALVRLLENQMHPLSAGIRWRLAALFDPGERPYEARKFALQFRRGSAKSNNAVDLEIAEYITREVAAGEKVERAVEDAATHFGTSTSTVWRAWRKFQASPFASSPVI